MTGPVLHLDDPTAPGNLTPEEYAATWAQPVGHDLPDEVAAAVAADAARPTRRLARAARRLTPRRVAAKLPLVWLPAYAHGGPFTTGRPCFVTVHCTESDNAAGTAEALAGPNWFGGTKAGTSAHKIVDRDSICEGVHRTTVAYHAGPGGNTYGIGYEFCGRAAWTAAQWREPAQLAELAIAAPHIADDLVAITGSRTAALAACRWLSVAQVAAKAKGLCTHNDVRLAFPGTTTHTDPGPNFPYAELLALVQAELAPAAPAAPVLAYPVTGAIRAAYDRVGGLAALGQPVGPEVPTRDPAGRWQEFDRGRAYWHPTVDKGTAHVLGGEIATRFVALGVETGCGWPITDELTCPDGVGRYNHFTGGTSIYWTPTTGARRVLGAIRTAWAGQGWETGKLGYPVDEEQATGEGTVQTFRGGSILSAAGATTVRLT